MACASTKGSMHLDCVLRLGETFVRCREGGGSGTNAPGALADDGGCEVGGAHVPGSGDGGARVCAGVAGSSTDRDRSAVGVEGVEVGAVLFSFFASCTVVVSLCPGWQWEGVEGICAEAGEGIRSLLGLHERGVLWRTESTGALVLRLSLCPPQDSDAREEEEEEEEEKEEGSDTCEGVQEDKEGPRPSTVWEETTVGKEGVVSGAGMLCVGKVSDGAVRRGEGWAPWVGHVIPVEAEELVVGVRLSSSVGDADGRGVGQSDGGSCARILWGLWCAPDLLDPHGPSGTPAVPSGGAGSAGWAGAGVRVRVSSPAGGE